MHRLVALLIAVATPLAGIGPALAQPSSPSTPPVPPPAPAAPAAPVAPVDPATPVAPPTPVPPIVQGDSADVAAAYDRAFAALVAGNYAAAAALFDDVALRSVDPERRGAARELARYARVEAQSTDVRRIESQSSNRAGVVVTSTIAGLYTGIVLDDLFGINDDSATALVITGATAAGLTGSLFATRGRHITEGMESSYSVGLLTGLGNGLLWAPVLGIDVDGECNELDCPDGEINQSYLGFGLATMIGGGAAGLYLGHRFDPTAPQVRFAGLMALNGFATAGLGLVTLHIDLEGENDTEKLLAILGTGLDLGLAAGVVIGRQLDWSGSRMTYVTLAEFVGGLAGGAAGVIVNMDDNDEQIYSTLILGGIWAGFGTAAYLTRDMIPHSRYATKSSTTVTLAPLSAHGARGVALTGTF